MTLKFNGVSYHVHPLDATTPVQDLGLIGDYCIGNVCHNILLSIYMALMPPFDQFQPIAAAAANSDIDAIMGMAFCKSGFLFV